LTNGIDGWRIGWCCRGWQIPGRTLGTQSLLRLAALGIGRLQVLESSLTANVA